ncbi:MAG TPA: cation:proton antiporter, partial [Segetibacter sp.]|nr:cation:proton antiporter [Segetibacter sp.]
ILAAIAGMTKEEVSSSFWYTLGISSLVFVGIVFFVLPFIIRWFFKRFDDSVSQYIFVLAIVFLSSFLAEAAGLEAIIGAFFSGLILNRFVPHTSPLMNRIDFVGNALFIPFFLISVGMLVDITVLIKGWGALKVAGVIVTIAIITKYIAALITQKVFNLLPEEGKMIFGLSTSHAAATLAIILVGYNIIIGEKATGEPIRLLNEDVLNGTILLILVSCAISSFVVERASRQLVLEEEKEVTKEPDEQQRILISLAYPESVTELVDLGLMLKPKKSAIPVYALHVVSDETNISKAEVAGKKMLEKAIRQAAATENSLTPLSRYDANISNGIIYTIKEQHITDLIIGLHQNANQKDFLGATTERIIRFTYETIFIYKSVQPLNTLKRMVVLVTPKAELEPGFGDWFSKLITVVKEAGLTLSFYAVAETIAELKYQQELINASVPVTFNEFSNWEDFLFFTSILKRDDLFSIITSRKGHVSYNAISEKLPYYLTKYFAANSFILIYPKQVEHGVKMDDVQFEDSTLAEKISVKVQDLSKSGDFLKKLFKK